MYSYARRASCRSVDVAEVAGRLPVHAAQVAHGTVEGDPHGLADARVPALHHLQLVYRLVNAQRDHLGLWKPLPLRKKTDCEARAHHLPMATLHMPGLHTPGSSLEPQSASPAGTPAAPHLTARHTATQPAGHRAAQQNPAGQPGGGGRVSKTSHPMTWGHCRAPGQGLRRASGRGLRRSLELEAVQPQRERPLQRARRMHEDPGGPALAVPRPSRGWPSARSRSAGPSSPAPLVVEEEHEEELLVGLGLHVLADLQHVQRRGRDGDPVVVARHARHLRVDDLHREGARSRHRRRPDGRWARRDPATPQRRDPDTPTP